MAATIQEALFDSLKENGYTKVVLEIQDYLHQAPKTDWGTITGIPFEADYTPEDEMKQVLWSMLVNLFGDFGVSNRTGWIDEPKAACFFWDSIVEETTIDFDWQDGWPTYVRTGEPVKEDENGNFIHEYPVS